jgi:hypothetical protein
MWKSTLLAFALLISSCASAEPCVKVRDGSDGTGPSGGYECMKFGDTQRRTAARFHLRLASPYKEVKTQMARNGWAVDPAWLKDYADEAIRGLPVCGHGWDAVCHIQMKRGKSVIVLTFSGTNDGMPLVEVEPTP